MVAGRQQRVSICGLPPAVLRRSNKGVWAWVEPERIDFPQTLPELAEDILKGKADLVVPERSLSCWKQLPAAQWMGEKAINKLWEIITNKSLDIAAGPKIGNYRSGHYFLDYNGEFGDIWDSTNCPLQYMINDKLILLSKEWKFLYPLDQMKYEQEDDTAKQKRLNQFSNLAQAIYHCSLKLNS